MKRMVTRLVPLVALAGLAAGAACQDSIAKGWLVDRPRVIAARVEAAADPGRASLGPSEHARVTWLLASPRGTPHFGWVYAACASPIGATAAPACDGPTLASGAGAADGELVATDLDTPAAANDNGLSSPAPWP